MIDAATFANAHNAFWNVYTPTCEHFVRRLNLSEYERFGPPMQKSRTVRRRAVIAEFAFSIFVERRQANRAAGAPVGRNEIESGAWVKTEARLRAYERQGLDLIPEWNEEERAEIDEIARRLLSFFPEHPIRLELRPIFAGCGLIDSSEGDVIAGGTIYEVKTVDRPFRSSDVRQVITYAALNSASEQYEIRKLGLCNPRRGQYYENDLDDVSVEISGRPSAELLRIIVDAVSSGEISR